MCFIVSSSSIFVHLLHRYRPQWALRLACFNKTLPTVPRIRQTSQTQPSIEFAQNMLKVADILSDLTSLRVGVSQYSISREPGCGTPDRNNRIPPLRLRLSQHDHLPRFPTLRYNSWRLLQVFWVKMSISFAHRICSTCTPM